MDSRKWLVDIDDGLSEKDGYLLALVQDSGGGTLIEIPAEIEPLRDLLCSVHHAASCG